MGARLGFIPPRLSRSRNSLPVLKNGRAFSSTGTGSPVRGLRPRRALRRFTVKDAETAQLDAIAANQRVGDPIEYRHHDQLDIGLQQMRIAGGEFRDEL